MAQFLYHLFSGLPANNCNSAACTSIAAAYGDAGGTSPNVPLVSSNSNVLINTSISPGGTGGGAVSNSCATDTSGGATNYADCTCHALAYSSTGCVQYAAGFGGTLLPGQAWYEDTNGNQLSTLNAALAQLEGAARDLYEILGQPTAGDVVDVTWHAEDPTNLSGMAFPKIKYCIRYHGTIFYSTVNGNPGGPQEYIDSFSSTYSANSPCPIRPHLQPATWAQNNSNSFNIYNQGVVFGSNHGAWNATNTMACDNCQLADFSVQPPSIQVCNDSQSPSYYQLSSVLQGCGQHASYSWGSVPQAQLASIDPVQCCTVNCQGEFVVPVPVEQGTSGWTGTSNYVNPVGTNNDGSISVDVLDPNNSYIASGTGPYVYIIDPGALGNAGGGQGVLCSSGITTSTSFTFDENSTFVSYPADPDNFPPRWPASTAAGLSILTNGLAAGTYTIHVVDSSATQNIQGVSETSPAGCVVSFDVQLITEAACIPDCADSTSLNYAGSGAVGCDPNNNGICDSGDNSCCLYCHKTNEYLTNYNSSQNLGQLGILSNSSVTDASTPTASDGSFSGTFSLNNLLTGLTQNQVANWTPQYRLYSYPTATDQVNKTNSTSVQGPVNAAWPGPSNVNFANALAPGYYSLKMNIWDSTSGAVEEIEFCKSWHDFTIKAPACTNQFASNAYSGTLDPGLLISTPSLCNFPCGFTLGPLTSTVNAINCSCYDLTFSITYLAPVTTVTVDAYYDDGLGGGPVLTSSVLTSSTTYSTQVCNAPGAYYFAVSGNTTGGSLTPPCDDNTNTVNVPVVITGCTDITANNYNINATCACATCCQYSTYECDMTSGQCSDPYPGPPGPYTTAAYGTAALALAACQANCIAPVIGCMDQVATNWNPSANVPCNTTWPNDCCIYKACLDPSASNYEYCNGIHYPANYLRQSSPGCCEYPCADPPAVVPTATDATVSSGCISNNDGSVSTYIKINNGATSYTVIFYDNWGNIVYNAGTLLTAAGNPIYVTTPSILPPGTYTVEVVDSSVPTPCTTTVVFAVGVDGSTCGCTNPNATNYDPSATVDDGSCIIPGCTDPNASNYNPIANTDDGSCKYQTIINPCIPKYLANAIYGLTACITKNGTNFLHKLNTGASTECSTMDAWKVILMQYLLSRVGLECIYNCADHTTPDRADAYTYCADEWVDGGSQVLDVSLPATVWAPGSVFQYSITLYDGSTLDYYFKTSTAYTTDCTTANFLSCLGDPNCIHWQCWDLCNPLMQGTQYSSSTSSSSTGNAVLSNVSYLTPSFTTNFIDNFVNFAQKSCVDCKNLTQDVADLGYLTDEEYTQGNFIFPYI